MAGIYEEYKTTLMHRQREHHKAERQLSASQGERPQKKCCQYLDLGLPPFTT
jgi:hypothetical protein